MARALWTVALTMMVGTLAVLARRSVRYVVEGESMTPTLAAGDWVLVRRTSTVRSEQIVVAERPDQAGFDVIKRVGSVDEGSRVMLLGDNPSASTDSRDFGPVAAEAVVGVVWFRYWPLRRVRVFRDGRSG